MTCLADTLAVAIDKLGPRYFTILLLGVLLILCVAIVIIVLFSKIAITIDRHKKWGIRIVRLEPGGEEIADLPVFSQPSQPTGPASGKKPPQKKKPQSDGSAGNSASSRLDGGAL